MPLLNLHRALAIIVRGLGGGAQIAVILIISHWYGLERLGNFSFYLAQAYFFSVVVGLGIPNYLLHLNSLHFEKSDFKSLINGVHAGALIIMLTATLVILISTLVISITDALEIVDVSWTRMSVSIVSGTMLGLVNLCCFTLRAQGAYILSNFLERGILYSVILVSFVLLEPAHNYSSFSNDSLVILLAGFLVSTTGYLSIRVSCKVRIDGGFLNGIKYSFLDFVKRNKDLTNYYGSLLFEMLLARSPVLIGGLLLVKSDLGAFQLVYSIAAAVLVFQEAIGGVFANKYAIAFKDRDTSLIRRLESITQKMFFSFIALLVFIYLVAREPVYGALFPNLGYPIHILDIAVTAVSLRMSFGLFRNIFEAVNKANIAIKLNFVFVILQIGLIAGLSGFGVVGLSVAWATSMALHSFIGFMIWKNELNKLELIG